MDSRTYNVLVSIDTEIKTGATLVYGLTEIERIFEAGVKSLSYDLTISHPDNDKTVEHDLIINLKG